jgi:hypothetical protein
LNIAANEILEIGAERACDPLQQGISTMSVAVASGVNGAGDSWVASTRRINSNDRREKTPNLIVADAAIGRCEPRLI